MGHVNSWKVGSVKMNAKEYAKIHKINPQKIKAWYEAGYMGDTIRNEKTGVYDIPEDTPVPYSARANVTTYETLWANILDAASHQNSMFSSMYPSFQEGTLERCIDDFVDAKYIRKIQTKSGVDFLELCLEGHKVIKEFSKPELKWKLTKVFKLVQEGTQLASALCTIFAYFA